MANKTYRVRAGFLYTDEGGATPRTFAAGETITLSEAVGDLAHQLEVAPADDPQDAAAADAAMAAKAAAEAEDAAKAAEAAAKAAQKARP